MQISNQLGTVMLSTTQGGGIRITDPDGLTLLYIKPGENYTFVRGVYVGGTWAGDDSGDGFVQVYNSSNDRVANIDHLGNLQLAGTLGTGVSF